MNRLQDCFDDDDAGESGDGFAGQLFQGMRHDPAKPLFEDRPRDMHPGVTRWMDQEPSGYVDGLNWYDAPVDEPVNRVDPLGMDT